MRRFLVLITVVVTVLGLTVPAFAQPVNDDLGNSTLVDILPFEASLDTTEATIEPDEPIGPDGECPPRHTTVWYALTLGASQSVAVDTGGSDYDTTLAVYTGTDYNDLSLVACNDDTLLGGLQSALSFDADAGATYLIQVGSFGEGGEAGGNLMLSIDEPGKATGKPVIFKSQFKGLLADAFIEEFEETTGTFRSAFVNLIDGQSNEGGKPSKFSSLIVSEFTETIDEVAEVVTVVEWFGFADLSHDQFAIDKKLKTAWVDADITLEGSECTFSFDEGEPECESLGSVEATAGLTWDGFGGTSKSRFSEKSSFDGVRVRFSSSFTTRQADVSGGVSNGFSIDFSEAFGSLNQQSSGEFVMIRGLN